MVKHHDQDVIERRVYLVLQLQRDKIHHDKSVAGMAVRLWQAWQLELQGGAYILITLTLQEQRANWEWCMAFKPRPHPLSLPKQHHLLGMKCSHI